VCNPYIFKEEENMKNNKHNDKTKSDNDKTNLDNDIIEAEYKEEYLPSTDVKYTQVDAEFEYARGNIIRILETSNEVLINTAELALESDHPRMVEVYSGLIKNIADINKSLFDIREKKMKIKGELQDVEENAPGDTINNNAIFVGSTEELLQVMNKGVL
jgi:hypothetical protein